MAKMRLWWSSSASLRQGLCRVTGIGVMRNWGGGCERMEPAGAAETGIAGLQSQSCPTVDERDAEGNRVAAVSSCLRTELPVFSAVQILLLFATRRFIK